MKTEICMVSLALGLIWERATAALDGQYIVHLIAQLCF